MGVRMKWTGVLALGLVACSGGGSEGKSTSLTSGKDASAEDDAAEPTEEDAGTEPADGGSEAPDAEAQPDDAEAPDGGPLFQLDLEFDGIPPAAVGVALHGPTGAVLELLTTDARGHAESPRAAASATVFLPSRVGLAEPPMPFTYLGVEPGDHLRMRLRDGSFFPDRAPLGELAASVQPVNSERSWNTLQLELGMSSCHDGQGNTVRYDSVDGEVPSTALTIGNYAECSTTPLHLLGTALFLGEGEEVVAYSFARDVPPPGAGEPTSVELPAWQLPAYIGLVPANLPSSYTSTTGNVAMMVGEERFETEYLRVPSPSGLLGRLMPYAAGFGDALEIMGFAERYVGDGISSFLQVFSRRPEADRGIVDFEMPETVSYSVTEAADGLTLSHTLSGALAGADAQIFTLAYVYDTGDGVVQAPWYVLLPADSQGATLPLAAAAESAGFSVDAVNVFAERVVTLSDDGLDGYAAFKERTAFIDLARGLPSQFRQRVTPRSTTGFDLQTAIDLAPRGEAGTARITGAGPYD